MRKLTEADVTFTVEALEEDIPVRGNLIDGGPGYEAEDKALEDAVIERLDRGDIWAWCTVRVTATCKGYSVDEYLGCCCYLDEADFTQPGGYFDDMKREALDRLNAQIETACSDLKELCE